MCGIVGFVDKVISPESGKMLLKGMLQTTSHRGPDSTGVWHDDIAYLGHNRLSIIDLSKAGNQPFIYLHLSIIFNGEIYNYLEVRQKLITLGYTFSSNSDTEVIPAAYLAWGENCVDHFVGMWAFAIWDTKTKELFCSRDRFGIKPFHYIFEDGRFYFASEFKPLKMSPIFGKELNYMQVSRYLQLGWMVYGEETIFSKIKNILPGHNMRLKNGKLTSTLYWKIEKKTLDLSSAEKYELLGERFKESIALHLRSDVPVVATLSGGIDSSAIVSTLVTSFKDLNLNTLSIYYENEDRFDERPFINEVINKYHNSISPAFYSASDDQINEDFHHSLYSLDTPSNGSSYFSLYTLMKEMKNRGWKVVISGQGADDYLGGYPHTYYRYLADSFLSQPLEAVKNIKEYKKYHDVSWGKMANVVAKSILSSVSSEQDLYSLEYNRYFPFLVKDDYLKNTSFSLPTINGNKTEKFLYSLMTASSLPSILYLEDRIPMAFSVETRVPFLDHRLVELGFSFTNEDRINHCVTKHALREATKNVLPEAIYNRRDKKGFVTPGEISWLRGPLAHTLDNASENLPFLHANKVTKLIADFKKGNNKNSSIVWRIAMLNYWVQNFQ